MNKRETERKLRIEEVIETIKKAKKDKKEIDYKAFLNVIMYKWGVARRTALEYIDVARSQL